MTERDWIFLISIFIVASTLVVFVWQMVRNRKNNDRDDRNPPSGDGRPPGY